MTVFDAFTYFNEVDLLEVRLREHDPFVDWILIAEGDRTHSGLPRGDMLDLKAPQVADFAPKFIPISVRSAPAPCDAWENERRQRDVLFESVTFDDDDIILLSDLDEIVSQAHWPDLLRQVKQPEAHGGLSLRLRLFYYFINLEITGGWDRARLATGVAVRRGGKTATDLRLTTDLPTTEQPCGWHFSYVGDERFIRNKIRSFAHQELNTSEFTNLHQIRRSIIEQRDLFDRDFLDFRRVDIDASWPEAMLEDPGWRSLCFQDLASRPYPTESRAGRSGLWAR
jgi:beta-1,4-mannosyl-glycoprotein beta-1,4-N-acetylglucosaminyltransferase